MLKDYRSLYIIMFSYRALLLFLNAVYVILSCKDKVLKRYMQIYFVNF